MAGPKNWAPEEPKIREKWVADSCLTSLFFMMPGVFSFQGKWMKMACRYIFECFLGLEQNVSKKCLSNEVISGEH